MAAERDIRHDDDDVMGYEDYEICDDTENGMFLWINTRTSIERMYIESDSDGSNDGDSSSELTSLSDEDDDIEESFLHDFKKYSESIYKMQRFMQEIADGADEELDRPGITLPKKGEQITSYERAGATHLVHSWYMQGRNKHSVFF